MKICWNKYRFEITIQPENNNLDYMIEPVFRNTNRLFVLLLEASKNDPTRNSFARYYMSLVEIKDINALIDNKPFFDQPVKNKQEAYEYLVEMSRNDYYTTGNFSDYSYHQNYYKLICKDLSRQTNMTIPQQISFIGRLEEDNVARMFLLLYFFQSYFKLFFRFVKCNRII